MSEPESSFYSIIIAPVMRCKELEPNAKLLYGEISGLAQKHGYCFASNKHFADLFDVEERTVKRWLESLEELKFIKRESEVGFGGKRKIFLSWDFQINFTEGQKCHGGVTKMSRGGDKNVTPTNTYSNTLEEQQQQAAVFYSCLASKDIAYSDKIWITEKYTEHEVAAAIEFVESPEFVIKTTFIQSLKWALKEKPDKQKSKQEQTEENKAYAKEVESLAICPMNVQVTALDKYVEFLFLGANCPSVCYEYTAYSHDAFKEKVREQCKKLKIVRRAPPESSGSSP